MEEKIVMSPNEYSPIKAYRQGQQDQKNGVEFFLNPHVFETCYPSCAAAWSAGWMKSYQESKGVKNDNRTQENTEGSCQAKTSTGLQG